ncbi:energy-coupling factor ABC transporter permease, partial [bacterium]|nr:energy-coupling factor ABC transporter permease [bacterium]
IMALPAMVCFHAFRSGIRSKNSATSMAASFLCGFGAIFLGSLLAALSLAFTGEHFMAVAKLIVIAHLPVMVIEGLVTAFCVKFLKRVKPEMLEVVYGR